MCNNNSDWVMTQTSLYRKAIHHFSNWERQFSLFAWGEPVYFVWGNWATTTINTHTQYFASIVFFFFFFFFFLFFYYSHPHKLKVTRFISGLLELESVQLCGFDSSGLVGTCGLESPMKYNTVNVKIRNCNWDIIFNFIITNNLFHINSNLNW